MIDIEHNWIRGFISYFWDAKNHRGIPHNNAICSECGHSRLYAEHYNITCATPEKPAEKPPTVNMKKCHYWKEKSECIGQPDCSVKICTWENCEYGKLYKKPPASGKSGSVPGYIAKVIENIEEQIAFEKKINADLDSASYGYEEGVLITVNDAQKLLDFIKAI